MPLTTFPNFHNLIPPVSSSLQLGTCSITSNTSVALIVVRKDMFCRLKVLKKLRTVSGVLCKGSLESDSEFVLEGEILEFMKVSRNPNEFPTKKELLDAGRVDLVDAIVKKGGWMSLGWDDSDDDESGWDSKEFDDVKDLDTRFDDCSLASCSSSHQCASSSGRSVETVIQEDPWLEGIVYRVEKQRSLCFDSSMRDGHCIYDSSKVNDGQRVYGSINVATGPFSVEKLNRHEEIDSDDIKSQLQRMKAELTSSLRLLRFIDKKTNNLPDDHKSSSSELKRLPDTFELHENEDVNVRDRLKSVCAKLAVIEEKLASSILDAKELLKKKEMRNNGECRNLQRLHSVCIIWHDSASEVLLVGSVDGWTTKRKMKKSEAGVFYLTLKLYPGRYEYKFIVDGVWRVDNLRPIVSNNGYENNVLIIPE